MRVCIISVSTGPYYIYMLNKFIVVHNTQRAASEHKADHFVRSTSTPPPTTRRASMSISQPPRVSIADLEPPECVGQVAAAGNCADASGQQPVPAGAQHCADEHQEAQAMPGREHIVMFHANAHFECERAHEQVQHEQLLEQLSEPDRARHVQDVGHERGALVQEADHQTV